MTVLFLIFVVPSNVGLEISIEGGLLHSITESAWRQNFLLGVAVIYHRFGQSVPFEYPLMHLVAYSSWRRYFYFGYCRHIWCFEYTLRFETTYIYRRSKKDYPRRFLPQRSPLSTLCRQTNFLWYPSFSFFSNDFRLCDFITSGVSFVQWTKPYGLVPISNVFLNM